MGCSSQILIASLLNLHIYLILADPNYRLVTLAIQNSALTIIMHYSRVSVPLSCRYSAATAVLMNEILKGAISLIIALIRTDISAYELAQAPLLSGKHSYSHMYIFRLRKLWKDVWSPDCWKLSIPAILYGKFYAS